MKPLYLFLAAWVALATTAQANTPPVDEYSRVPKGVLLSAEQREALKGKTPVDEAGNEAPAIDPQVPTHSVASLTDEDDKPQARKIAGMAEIEAAYAEGRYAEIIGPLEQLAAQNDLDAALMLGIMLDNGQGGPAQPERAAGLMMRAAEGGLALAQHRVAIMYYQGRGIAKDDVRAMMWLHIAVAKYPPGPAHDRAVSDRNNLDAGMARRDRETALFMAKEWLQKRGEGHLLDADTATP